MAEYTAFSVATRLIGARNEGRDMLSATYYSAPSQRHRAEGGVAQSERLVSLGIGKIKTRTVRSAFLLGNEMVV